MYEKYWDSDEERDANELSALMQDKFIDNLKKGGQLPLVLPAKDEPQFRRLVTKKALKHDQSDTEPTIKSELMEISTSIMDNSDIDKPNSNQTEAGPGATIKNLVHDTSSPLMMFQLPSSLAKLSDSSKPIFSGDPAAASQMEVGAALKQQQLNTKPAAVDFQGKAKHCLTGLPTGVEVGKLQILRSGRTVMNIGGHVMDVTEAIPSQCFETAVYIETYADDPASGTGPSASTAGASIRNNVSNNGSGLFTSKTNGIFPSPSATQTSTPSRETNSKTKNSISVLGEIPYAFVCSYDLRSRKNQHCSNGQTLSPKNQRT